MHTFFRRKVKRFWLLGIFLISLTASFARSETQLDLVKTIDHWKLFCAHQTKAADDCAIVQATVDRNIDRTLRVSFAFRPDGKLRLRVITGPIFGETKRVSLLVDGEQTGFKDADVCNPSGCSFSMTLPDPNIIQLRNSKQLGFETQIDNETGVLATVDSEKLGDALLDLHTHVTQAVKLGPYDFWAPKTELLVANEEENLSWPVAHGSVLSWVESCKPDKSSMTLPAFPGTDQMLGSNGISNFKWSLNCYPRSNHFSDGIKDFVAGGGNSSVFVFSYMPKSVVEWNSSATSSAFGGAMVNQKIPWMLSVP